MTRVQLNQPPAINLSRFSGHNPKDQQTRTTDTVRFGAGPSKQPGHSNVTRFNVIEIIKMRNLLGDELMDALETSFSQCLKAGKSLEVIFPDPRSDSKDHLTVTVKPGASDQEGWKNFIDQIAAPNSPFQQRFLIPFSQTLAEQADAVIQKAKFPWPQGGLPRLLQAKPTPPNPSEKS